jgi:hypothetical protein
MLHCPSPFAPAAGWITHCETGLHFLSFHHRGEAWPYVDKRFVSPAKAGVQKARVKQINALLDAGFHRHDGIVITAAMLNKRLG